MKGYFICDGYVGAGNGGLFDTAEEAKNYADSRRWIRHVHLQWENRTYPEHITDPENPAMMDVFVAEEENGNVYYVFFVPLHSELHSEES